MFVEQKAIDDGEMGYELAGLQIDPWFFQPWFYRYTPILENVGNRKNDRPLTKWHKLLTSAHW